MAEELGSAPETPPTAGKHTFPPLFYSKFLVYFGLATYATECPRALRAPLILFYHVFFWVFLCYMVCLLLWLHVSVLSEVVIELLGPLP